MSDSILKLREVKREDIETLWRWANDPVAREFSLSSKSITWDEHVKWFSEKLNSPYCYQYIAFINSCELVGQLRFDLNDKFQAIVSISLEAHMRNKGYGKQILRLGLSQFLQNTKPACFLAIIKPENIASLKLFERVGFRRICNSNLEDSFTYIYDDYSYF